MSKDAMLTVKLEPELRDAFMAEAQASHRPASQILREMMRDFVSRQRGAREYEAYLQTKVDLARQQVAAEQTLTAAEVQARASTRRARLLKQSRKSGV